MKGSDVALIGALILFGATLTVSMERTFCSEIMDTQCAKMSAHDVMMKKEVARDCFNVEAHVASANAIRIATIGQASSPSVGMRK